MHRGPIRNIKLILMWMFYLNFAWFAFLVAWLDRKFKFRMPFPRDIAELSDKKQWCIEALKKNGILPKDAVITGYKVTPLNQDIIYRSNAGKLEIEYTHLSENKTLACLAKFAPVVGSVWNRAIFNMQLNHIKEIFFNKYFASVDKAVASPAIYYAEFALVTGNLCLIMEFMGDNKLYLDGVVEEVPWEHLNLAFGAMASLHAHYWKDNSSRMSKVFPIGPANVDFFDSTVSGKWSIPARKILVQSWNHCNRRQTVIHGDARIGNMMFPGPEGRGRFVFIDWQAVRKGIAVYDLAYFLVLSLWTAKRLAVEQQAIDIYFKFLTGKGVKDYTREELDEDYKHACLCLLVLLSLPMLSGEASAEGQGAIIFAWGMNVWRERLQAKFEDFDYAWLANRYGITENEGRKAISEMLQVIENRLKRISAAANA